MNIDLEIEIEIERDVKREANEASPADTPQVLNSMLPDAQMVPRRISSLRKKHVAAMLLQCCIAYFRRLLTFVSGCIAASAYL